MGRKRLLTILAGLVAAVGLTVGPAAAQVNLPGIGSVDIGAGGVNVDLDTGIPGVLELDPSIDVDISSGRPKVDIKGGAKVGGQNVPVGDLTQPLEDAVNGSSGGSTGGGSGSGGGGSTGGGGSSGGGGGGETAPKGGNNGGGGASGGQDVEVAGNEPEVAEVSPDRERQLAALNALRDDLSSASSFGGPGGGPVAPGIIGPPAPDELTFLAPEVADAADPDVLPGIGSVADPLAADEPHTAVLATSPISRAAQDVPALLKLLAGGLVLGSAALWATAKQELGVQRETPTTA